MRLHAQTAVFENGFVFLPDEAPWLADYLAELTAFPMGRHDDQVESTSQALAWAKRPKTGAEAWIEFYRQPWGPRPERTVASFAGRHEPCAHRADQLLLPRARPLVEAEREDAPFLLRIGFRRDL